HPATAGASVDVHVYFHVEQPTATAYRFQLAAWQVDPAAPDAAPAPGEILRTALRATASGAFPTDRWKAGDHVRERVALSIPATWPGAPGAGLVVEDAAGNRYQPTGARLASDPAIAVLGTLPLTPAGSSAAPHPQYHRAMRPLYDHPRVLTDELRTAATT